MLVAPARSSLFPYTTLFRSQRASDQEVGRWLLIVELRSRVSAASRRSVHDGAMADVSRLVGEVESESVGRARVRTVLPVMLRRHQCSATARTATSRQHLRSLSR